MSERPFDSMRERQELDRHITGERELAQSEANRPCPEPLTSENEFGNLKTAQDVAYRIFAEITVIPADAQAAKVIALISQAVAQARVDEAKWWYERYSLHLYTTDAHFPGTDPSQCKCTDCKYMADLERDLAAIAKENTNGK